MQLPEKLLDYLAEMDGTISVTHDSHVRNGSSDPWRVSVFVENDDDTTTAFVHSAQCASEALESLVVELAL